MYLMQAILFLTIISTLTMAMTDKVIIWDNDGTIKGSLNPNDTTSKAKVILPNVKKIMQQPNTINVICSGCKTPESELQNFDPDIIIEKFKVLMAKLPVQVAVFSPAIGGTECWVLLKINDKTFEVRKAHENNNYAHLIGTFKKPGTGMLKVLSDILQELYIYIDRENTVFIGDTEHDQLAAHSYNIPFIHAKCIHEMKDQHYLDYAIKTNQINQNI